MTIHIRTTGYRIDRRFRMGGMHTTNGGPPFCGAEGGAHDFDRKNAAATIEHARVLAGYPALRVHETAARLCPACVAGMTAADAKKAAERKADPHADLRYPSHLEAKPGAQG